MRHLFVLAWALVGMSLQAQELVPPSFNLDHEHVPGQLIVKFSGEIPEQLKDRVIKVIPKPPGLKAFAGSTTVLLDYSKVKGDEALKAIAKDLSESSGVASVEANVIYRLFENLPNDPDFDRLYGLRNVDADGAPRGGDISAGIAWEANTGSKDVVVGVIDTGIDYNHPDLRDNIWINEGEMGVDEDGNDLASNGIDDDGNGYVDDWRGWDFINDDNDPMDGNSHGTHCAGTIGAKGNNGVGVVGVNWDVSLVGLKVFTDRGSTTVDALAEAINYATVIGVDLTSNSWGGGSASPVIRDAIQGANEAGIMFVAAAGNSSANNDRRPNYPSSYEIDNIIAVASTDSRDRLSSFSSYGPTSVDVGAPGSNIFSTVPGGRYGSKSGTSMATPHVAGLVALVKAQFPELDYMKIKNRILATSDVLESLTGRVKYGRINAASSLEIDEIAPSTPGELFVARSGLTSVALSWQVSGDDGDAGEASRYELRISDQPITDESWDQSVVAKVSIESVNEGRVVGVLSGLELNLSAYVAIKAFDNVGNVSAISESIKFQLQEAEVLVSNDGSLDLFANVDDPWSVVEVDGNSYLSDSPRGEYRNNINISLVSSSVEISTSDVIIFFDTQYELETNYDYGYLELRVPGGSWQQVAAFNGSKTWSTEFFELRNFLDGAQSFRFRFRLKTDSSITKDGWSIDNIRVMVPSST